MKYVASCSFGKDSLAMVLRLIEEHKPLDYVVFYDTGMEYQAIYHNMERLKPILASGGIEFVCLKPDTEWWYEMLIKPKHKRNGQMAYGNEWCGRMCRWRTLQKVPAIHKWLHTIGEHRQYIGIALDEPQRIPEQPKHNELYPLVEWKMKEADCLAYCYEKGFNWNENGVELYDVLDRVSCWCCWNKNISELRRMRKYLPKYWQDLLGLQSRIDIPFKDNASLFDLDERFANEDAQMSLFDEKR